MEAMEKDILAGDQDTSGVTQLSQGQSCPPSRQDTLPQSSLEKGAFQAWLERELEIANQNQEKKLSEEKQLNKKKRRKRRKKGVMEERKVLGTSEEGAEHATEAKDHRVEEENGMERGEVEGTAMEAVRQANEQERMSETSSESDTSNERDSDPLTVNSEQGAGQVWLQGELERALERQKVANNRIQIQKITTCMTFHRLNGENKEEMEKMKEELAERMLADAWQRDSAWEMAERLTQEQDTIAGTSSMCSQDVTTKQETPEVEVETNPFKSLGAGAEQDRQNHESKAEEEYSIPAESREETLRELTLALSTIEDQQRRIGDLERVHGALAAWFERELEISNQSQEKKVSVDLEREEPKEKQHNKKKLRKRRKNGLMEQGNVLGTSEETERQNEIQNRTEPNDQRVELIKEENGMERGEVVEGTAMEAVRQANEQERMSETSSESDTSNERDSNPLTVNSEQGAGQVWLRGELERALERQKIENNRVHIQKIETCMTLHRLNGENKEEMEKMKEELAESMLADAWQRDSTWEMAERLTQEQDTIAGASSMCSQDVTTKQETPEVEVETNPFKSLGAGAEQDRQNHESKAEEEYSIPAERREETLRELTLALSTIEDQQRRLDDLERMQGELEALFERELEIANQREEKKLSVNLEREAPKEKQHNKKKQRKKGKKGLIEQGNVLGTSEDTERQREIQNKWMDVDRLNGKEENTEEGMKKKVEEKTAMGHAEEGAEHATEAKDHKVERMKEENGMERGEVEGTAMEAVRQANEHERMSETSSESDTSNERDSDPLTVNSEQGAGQVWLRGELERALERQKIENNRVHIQKIETCMTFHRLNGENKEEMEKMKEELAERMLADAWQRDSAWEIAERLTQEQDTIGGTSSMCSQDVTAKQETLEVEVETNPFKSLGAGAEQDRQNHESEAEEEYSIPAERREETVGELTLSQYTIEDQQRRIDDLERMQGELEALFGRELEIANQSEEKKLSVNLEREAPKEKQHNKKKQRKKGKKGLMEQGNVLETSEDTERQKGIQNKWMDVDQLNGKEENTEEGMKKKVEEKTTMGHAEEGAEHETEAKDHKVERMKEENGMERGEVEGTAMEAVRQANEQERMSETSSESDTSNERDSDPLTVNSEQGAGQVWLRGELERALERQKIENNRIQIQKIETCMTFHRLNGENKEEMEKMKEELAERMLADAWQRDSAWETAERLTQEQDTIAGTSSMCSQDVTTKQETPEVEVETNPFKSLGAGAEQDRQNHEKRAEEEYSIPAERRDETVRELTLAQSTIEDQQRRIDDLERMYLEIQKEKDEAQRISERHSEEQERRIGQLEKLTENMMKEKVEARRVSERHSEEQERRIGQLEKLTENMMTKIIEMERQRDETAALRKVEQERTTAEEMERTAGGTPNDQPKTVATMDTPNDQPKTVATMDTPNDQPKTVATMDTPNDQPKTVATMDTPNDQPKTVATMDTPNDQPKTVATMDTPNDQPKTVTTMEETSMPTGGQPASVNSHLEIICVIEEERHGQEIMVSGSRMENSGPENDIEIDAKREGHKSTANSGPAEDRSCPSNDMERRGQSAAGSLENCKPKDMETDTKRGECSAAGIAVPTENDLESDASDGPSEQLPGGLEEEQKKKKKKKSVLRWMRKRLRFGQN
ncbi:trichohyalin-like [Engraulis encrasicolus]|uniref:trichohyalin-like n=1 Tax=Engraulis encrasicolus TaxID=184585 RepID=UPI002FD1CA5D